MSRVYDTPRYKNQTLYKCIIHLDAAETLNKCENVKHCFGNSQALEVGNEYLRYLMGMYEMLDGHEQTEQISGDLDECEMFQRYVIVSGIQRSENPNIRQTASIGCVLNEIFTDAASRGRKVWTDYDASARLTEGYLSGRYEPHDSGTLLMDNAHAASLARDIAVTGMASCRLGQNVTKHATSDYRNCAQGSARWQRMYVWCRGMEDMRMRALTPKIRDAHTKIRDGYSPSPCTAFENTSGPFVRYLGAEHYYRVVGLNILVYSDAVYVLDYSATEQVHAVAKTYEGCLDYGHNFRLSGNLSTQRVKYEQAVNRSMDWVGERLVETGFSDKLARSMKQSLALLQNNIHASSETLDVKLENKAAQMVEAIAEILPMSSYWHDFVVCLGLPERLQLDIANMFYALPAPDCDVRLLFERASKYMQKARSVNWDMWSDFMNYCKSLDFCKAVCKFGEEVTFKTTDGYEVKDKPWYLACRRGTLMLPPDDELGHAWIEGFFPFVDSLPTWYWEASDVTRVMPDMSVYQDLQHSSKIPRDESNELLYALEHAPLLAPNINPSDVYARMAVGLDKWDRVAEMAAKCENTKPGDKVRETWSADAVTRELTSCYDRSAIPLASLYTGVTARKGQLLVDKIFDSIRTLTMPSSKKKVIIISNDVSGWSPLADRHAWMMHHDYVVRTTKAPSCLKLSIIWRNITAVLSKRGFLGATKIDKGLFQGWTGTADSVLNVRLSLYCVRRARRKGFLLQSEGAHTAGLIDDAVQAVELDPKSSHEHMQNAADTHFETSVETWGMAAAELDPVKTLYSSVKFIFLNRFFCEGSEVLTPMKVYARIDREHNRRFATIHQQLDTVLGASRAAAGKGACPIACYMNALTRCMELVMRTSRLVKGCDSVVIINAAYAPRAMGGWGIPHIGAYLTQESKDALSQYTSIMSSLHDVAGCEDIKAKVASFLEQTLGQELAKCSIPSILAAPWSVVAEAAPNPTGDIMAKIRQGMIQKCKSDVFKRALQPTANAEFYDGMRQVLENCAVDISTLALLGQCLPDACSSALVDRAYRNELVMQLFPFRVKTELSRRLRASGRAAIQHLLSLRVQEVTIEVSRATAYELARDCRNRFFDVNNLNVTNHTIPDYISSLARQPTAQSASISVGVAPTVSPCPNEGVDYSSMYDKIPAGEQKRGIRTASVYNFSNNQFRVMTPVQKCINTAAIVSAHMSHTGGDGKLFWNLVALSWGASKPMSYPTVECRIREGTSLKRLNPHVAHRTHDISAFRNFHPALFADATRLGRYLSSRSVHVDFMSYVTVAKVVYMLELASHPQPKKFEKEQLHYAFVHDALPDTEPDVLSVINREEVQDGLERMRRSRNQELEASYMSCLVNYTFDRDDDEEYMSVTHDAPQYFPGTAATAATIQPGYISYLLSAAAPVSMPGKRVAGRHRVVGEEMSVTVGSSSAYRYRKYTESVGPSQAVLMLMMDTVRESCKQTPNLPVLSARWREMPSIFEREFPNWRELWVNVRNMAAGFVSNISTEASMALLGAVPHHVRMHLCSLDRSANESSLLIIAYLYCAAYGRPRTAESYTLTSAFGHKYIARCWSLAATIRRGERGNTPYNNARRLMGRVYDSMAASARVVSERTAVLCAMISAVESFVAKECNDHNQLESIDPEYQVEDVIRSADWLPSLLDHIRRMIECCKRAIDIAYVCREVEQLVDDVRIMGQTRLIQEAHPVHVLISSRGEGAHVDLPEPGQVFSVEEEVVQMDDVVDEVYPLRTRQAAAAYLTLGIEVARRVMDGDEEYIMDFEPSVEEIEEFIEEYNDEDAFNPGMQRPDEAN